jgi:hypothetical protein
MAGKGYGTVAYWFRVYLAEAAAGRVIGAKGKPLRPRTIERLHGVQRSRSCAYFGKMFPADDPARPDGEVPAPARAAGGAGPGNREKSCLSALLTWLRATSGRGRREGEPVPPHRQEPREPRDAVRRGRRAPRRRRDRGAHGARGDDARLPHAAAPDDVLSAGIGATWSTKTFAGTRSASCGFVQSKTGREMEIEITPELDASC